MIRVKGAGAHIIAWGKAGGGGIKWTRGVDKRSTEDQKIIFIHESGLFGQVKEIGQQGAGVKSFGSEQSRRDGR